MQSNLHVYVIIHIINYIYTKFTYMYYIKGMNNLWSRGCLCYYQPTIFDRELGSKA